MDDKAIVLIIGAGGSVPFGFPTGEKLKWAICDGLADVKKVNAAQTKNHLAEALLKEGFNVEELVKLRAYPNNPEQRNVIMAQTK